MNEMQLYLYYAIGDNLLARGAICQPTNVENVIVLITSSMCVSD